MSAVAQVATAAGTRRAETRLEELDSLRGIAASIVLLFHFTYLYDLPHHSPISIWWGHYGVELFFVISGFVILMTSDKSRTIPDFLISRVARLYPAYWCAVLLTSFFALILNQSDHISAGRLVANLTMFHSFMFANIHSIDGSYWTLARELVFYLMIVAWMRFRSNRLPNIEWYASAWIAIAAAIRLLLYVRHIAEPPAILTGPLLIDYGQFFIIGMCLYRLHAGRASRLTLLVFVAACLMSLFGGDSKSLSVTPIPYFLATCSVAAVVWAAIRFRPAILRNPVLLFLGGISYPLYLVHNRIGMELMSLAKTQGYSWGVTTPLIIGTIILLAYAIHVSVEMPGRAFLRLKLGGLLQTTTSQRATASQRALVSVAANPSEPPI